MPMAIANPEELIGFSNDLERYINTLETETNALNASFSHLGETWQDQQRKAFEETYNQLQSALAAFKENANEQIPYLRAMAEDLNSYLSR